MYKSEIEQIALDILRDENGYTVLFGPDISESEQKEREYTDVILQNRLRDAIDRINPSIPVDAREEAFKKAMRTVSVNLLDNNEAFHRMLTEGVDVKFGIGEGKTKGDKVWLVDFSIAANNEFLAVNQYTVLENHNNKRPDIVLFINGLPLVVVELKDSVQAKLRVLVRRIPRKYKYPPDDPSTGEYNVSVSKVLDQAELLADFWTKL